MREGRTGSDRVGSDPPSGPPKGPHKVWEPSHSTIGANVANARFAGQKPGSPAAERASTTLAIPPYRSTHTSRGVAVAWSPIAASRSHALGFQPSWFAGQPTSRCAHRLHRDGGAVCAFQATRRRLSETWCSRALLAIAWRRRAVG